MAEGDRVDISEEVNPPVPAHSQPPPMHAPPLPTPAGILPAYSGAPPTHLPPPTSSGAPLLPTSLTSSASDDQARITALEGTVNQMATNMAELLALLRGPNRASSSSTPPPGQGPTVDPTPWVPLTQAPENMDTPAPPTLHTSTAHPFTSPFPPPPAPTAVPLPPTTFLTSDQVLSAPPPVSMPAPATIYAAPPPTVFLASSAPAPTHPQAAELPSYPPLQPHTSFPYQAPPPISTTFHEPGTPTQATQFASPTHFFAEADTKQERRLKRMEETIRALQANDARPDACYGDCSLFPGMRLPPKFKLPEFKTYKGTTDPRHHLRHYRAKMLQYWEYEEAEDIPTWEDLSRKFIDQYRYCAEAPPTLLELSTKEMAQGQRFEEYATKWRAQAAKHIPPISEAQQIQLFHSTLRGVYYSHLLAHTSSFSDLIEAGKKLDLGIKLGRMEGPASKGEESSKKVLATSSSSSRRRGKEVSVNAVNTAHQASQQYSTNFTSAPPVAPSYAPHAPQYRPQPPTQPIYYSALPPPPPPTVPSPVVHHYAPTPSQAPQYQPPAPRASQPTQRVPPPQDVPAREPYSDGKVPWTYEGSVGSLEQQLGFMGITRSGRAAQVPKGTSPNRTEETINSIFSNTISFSNDELPSEGCAHSRALHIVCKCNNHIVGRVMIDICPVTTLKQMNIDLNRVRLSKTAVRAFDGSQREVNGEIDLLIDVGSGSFSVIFQVLDIPNAFSLLLGRPWIHSAGAIPSSLHQKLKFIVEERIITVKGEEDYAIYKETAATLESKSSTRRFKPIRRVSRRAPTRILRGRARRRQSST
ncbi:hypothetical protein CRG98_001923 [Punica granatum]|uniref:Retrotransposon gag domain-containing protein n=1 Tax=Punica granatum TaxID=22663 RepID=A0A2I0LAH6_PUNGR|nr:hypothetical protein CRG98_001923 [Punica granatum]